MELDGYSFVLLKRGPRALEFSDEDLYRTGVEETRRLAQSDPSVRAGRMAVDVMGWWTASGALEALGRELADE